MLQRGASRNFRKAARPLSCSCCIPEAPCSCMVHTWALKWLPYHNFDVYVNHKATWSLWVRLFLYRRMFAKLHAQFWKAREMRAVDTALLRNRFIKFVCNVTDPAFGSSKSQRAYKEVTSGSASHSPCCFLFRTGAPNSPKHA